MMFGRLAIVVLGCAGVMSAAASAAQDGPIQTAPRSGAAAPAAEFPPTPPAPGASARSACSGDEAVVKADAAVMRDAGLAFRSGGYRALGEHVAALRSALADAPPEQRLVERCRNEVRVHTPSHAAFLKTSAALRSNPGYRGIGRVTWEPTPYPTVSLLLGSFYNERRDWKAAEAVLSQGLALDPDDAAIATEYAGALVHRRRFEAALDVCGRFPISGQPLAPTVGARLEQMRGSALEGLSRWDEAEAALRTALTLAPGDANAQAQLAKIAKRRAEGGRPFPNFHFGRRTDEPPTRAQAN